MAEATAWILKLGDGLRVAVSERELTHFIERPTLEDVPQTPTHCRQVLLWEGEILPVIDLTAWLTGQQLDRGRGVAGIVGWQDQPGAAPQYGALLFTEIPQKVKLKDEQACALPSQPQGLPQIAASCFVHDKRPVPILDLPQLFSNALAAGR
ncbi:MAG: chemotaxis protein CheW [Gammaproteobacteria bacterium]